MENSWEQICGVLASNLPDAQYKVWISPLDAKLDGDNLKITAMNEFVAKFVRNRFLDAIAAAASQVLGRRPEIVVNVAGGGPIASPIASPAAPALGAQLAGGLYETAGSAGTVNPMVLPEPRAQDSIIRGGAPATAHDHASGPASASGSAQARLPIHWPEKDSARLVRGWRFRFEDFVVGPCNELAHAAARGICATDHCRLGSSDILFLCSPPGLGKTHLMQSVGAGLVQASNLAAPRVEYLSAEEFANQMRFSLRNGDIDRFKQRYRQADVLLMEDVHFLQDKEKTQNEVLATLIALLDRGSRVVLTSSFALPELKKMDSQLFSRLGAGLIAAIDRPDAETRRRIISRKAADGKLTLSAELTDYLAENINSDVRQIESCLRNLALKASILNRCIDLDMARETVASYLGSAQVLTLSGIVRLVCEGFGITAEALNSKSRKQGHVQARNAAFFLARKHTNMSLQEIGKRFNRTHSTVIKGITTLEREVSRQSTFGRQLANVIATIERNGMGAQGL